MYDWFCGCWHRIFERNTDSKSLRVTGHVFGPRQTSDNLRKQCKCVLNKLQDGHQLVPTLTDFWKRCENAGGERGTNMDNNPLDLRAINQWEVLGDKLRALKFIGIARKLDHSRLETLNDESREEN
ncbi:hypothetical protein AMTR_s00088p00165570 [Amborella trichopoda]|uniref:Uncharacterized protein n=1 Tax=Amborella trichopoda TaxID=13333 RepID=W1NWC3_AMBTC|nr:hypothetical protein AMTR_s00088p00165570 [Amborella trichopoda]